jgi:hypothetical protein
VWKKHCCEGRPSRAGRFATEFFDELKFYQLSGKKDEGNAAEEYAP